jgi:hypothetical protein
MPSTLVGVTAGLFGGGLDGGSGGFEKPHNSAGELEWADFPCLRVFQRVRARKSGDLSQDQFPVIREKPRYILLRGTSRFKNAAGFTRIFQVNKFLHGVDGAEVLDVHD